MLRQMHSGVENLQHNKAESFSGCKRPRVKQSRPGRAKKPDDKRTHQSFDHQTEVRVARIKVDRVPDKQRPERNADRTEQQTDRKENSKRFYRCKLEKILPT